MSYFFKGRDKEIGRVAGFCFCRADSPLIVEHCEFDLSTATNAFYWHNDFEIILVKTGLCEID
ncbi:hypothetical protein PT100_08845, partial [Erysipelothrix rhusiopathiae]|nr:hypothetical protein [Erysipelothrix rhusiopathiae]